MIRGPMRHLGARGQVKSSDTIIQEADDGQNWVAGKHS